MIYSDIYNIDMIPSKRGWVDFFEGDRQASDDHFGVTHAKPASSFCAYPRNSFNVYNAVAFQGSFQEGSGLHRLRFQWKCGFIGLYFMDLQGSCVPGAKRIKALLDIILLKCWSRFQYPEHVPL